LHDVLYHSRVRVRAVLARGSDRSRLSNPTLAGVVILERHLALYP